MATPRTYDPEVEAAFGSGEAAPAPSNTQYDPEVLDAFPDSTDAQSTAEGQKPTLSETMHRGGLANPLNWPIGQFAEHEGSALRSQFKAGAGAIYDLATGKSISDADRRAQRAIEEGTFKPPGLPAKVASAAFDSPANPLNWPSTAFKYAGKGITAAMTSNVMPEKVREAGVYVGPVLEGVANMALGTYGAKKGLGLGEKPPSILGEPGGAVHTPAGFDSEHVAGGVPQGNIPARAAVLRRLGLDTARESALTGDSLAAATDYQISKFSGEPAGVQAKAHFDVEKAALENHAAKIVEKTGGTLGMDEDSLGSRGQTIAAPFDALRQYFSEQKKADYAAADARAKGAPVSDLSSTRELLSDPDFTETLLAKGQGSLLDSVKRQFDRFNSLATQDKAGPAQWTVANAENFRKWMNQVWTPENSATLGKLKAAVDEDVLKGAGEDIYGPARKRVQLEHELLDNPDGVATLFDRDPKTPINRKTAYSKIPDTLWRLAPEQFTNIVDTLKKMPPEVQQHAQAALAEIKAHGANRLHEAGMSTEGQWAASKVSRILKANSSKFQTAFGDTPELLGDIQTLDAGGRILKTPQSYPGAAAQAANMLKRGMMSHAISRGGGSVGALAGSVLGAPGAAVGAAIGEAAGGRLGATFAEKAALNRWGEKLVPLEQLVKPKD